MKTRYRQWEKYLQIAIHVWVTLVPVILKIWLGYRERDISPKKIHSCKIHVKMFTDINSHSGNVN
jgi:hypothetical protein